MDNLISQIKKVREANPTGFTVDLKMNPAPKTGFAVSLRETQNNFGIEGLKRVIRAAQKNSTYIGGWKNEEDGKFYYDVTIIVQDEKEAIKIAKEQKQLAIFDLETLKTIWV